MSQQRIGFTGTREELTVPQRGALRNWIVDKGTSSLHHGDCVGADKAAHEIAFSQNWRIVIHPAVGVDHLKAHCKFANEIRAPKRPLDRNTDIVNCTQVLLACPKGPEEARSGTWSTIRKARRLRRPITIIMPSGEVLRENYDDVDDLV